MVSQTVVSAENWKNEITEALKFHKNSDETRY